MTDYGRVLRIWDDAQRERLSGVAQTLGLETPLFTGFPTVHVAGTNGKGSVCAMVAAILMASGYRTGLFTSPHLYRENERILVDGTPILEEVLTAYLDEIYARYPDLRLFDGYLYAALRWYTRQKVAFGVMEAGVGGALDATNILLPQVTAIATIGMDHREILGDTLCEIALQKAGIAKPGVPMALYPRYPGEVERTIRDHCRRVGAPVLAYEPGELELRPGEDGSWRLDIRRPGLSLLDTRVSLMGRHQAYNAALAVLIAQALMEQGYGITPDAIREGLMAARHPGRLELIEQTPILLLDGAHNPEGAAALATAIRDAYPSKPLVLLTAMMSNKDASGVAAQLAPLADRVIATQVDAPRALDCQRLAAFYGEKAQAVSDPRAALSRARELCPQNGVLLVAGSLYLPHALGLG